MPFGLFQPKTWFASGPVERTRAMVRMSNARDYDGMGQAVTEDFLHLDTAGAAIKGREAFLVALRELHRQADDLKIETDDVFEQDEDVLIRGRLVSTNPDYCSESLWRVRFADDGRVSEIQAFRENNQISIARLTAHLRRKPS